MTQFRKPRLSPRAVALSLVAALAVSACNTVEGIGEDTQSAGKAIEDVANDVKD